MNVERKPSPLASVIVAVRNSERFLARALGSIFAQDYAPYEVLVVDGHSTDATETIARSFAGIRFLVQPGTGIADAYNHGWRSAGGDFVAFLSSDDEWLPPKLSTQISYHLDHPEVQITLAHAHYVLEPGCEPPPGFRRDLLEGEHPGAMETLVARRGVLDLVGEFDGRYSTGEDLDWVARARDRGVPMVRLAHAHLVKHIHDVNISLISKENDRLILSLLKDSIARKRGWPVKEI